MKYEHAFDKEAQLNTIYRALSVSEGNQFRLVKQEDITRLFEMSKYALDEWEKFIRFIEL